MKRNWRPIGTRKAARRYFRVMFILHNSEGVSQVSKSSGNRELGNWDLEVRSVVDSL